ncbi:protein phosphatase 1 regulatory subunit 27-like [Conger conger]|uniref:protein phosphatase 1 regulatory subunit 27-like n=1 Tax=Conger conger TaxID=82655 RepID=UPI002A5B0A47|nr:protein phosphatase 1 regulatory subunit 27-like [Conger conger]
MKYSLQSLVDEYSRGSHYKPTPLTHTPYAPSANTHTAYSPSAYTHTPYSPSAYTHTAYTPSAYTASAYTPARYTPAQYTPTHYTSSAAKSSFTASGPTPTPSPSPPPAPSAREERGYAGSRRAQKAARTVHFPNDVVFQDNIRQGDMTQVGRFLRTQKVRVNKPFPSGMSAIHEAVLSGSLDCVKLLVTYGADVDLRDDDGWTPLHMACSDGYPEIAEYLLTRGASTAAKNESGEKPVDLIDPECAELVKLFAAV